ncbi:MAG: 50S ribosomal protein L29 [Limisphaerales bacterium]
MKAAELKDFTIPELTVKGRDLRQELFNLRLQQASSQLEKPARLRLLRKDVARIETQISALRLNPTKTPTGKVKKTKAAKK